VRTVILGVSLGAVIVAVMHGQTPAASQAKPVAVAATRSGDGVLRAMDAQVDLMLRTRDLRVRDVMRDADLADRRHERLDQYYRGVRIEGGDLTRQIASDGTVSVFGMLHTGLDFDTAPALSVDEARAAAARAVNGQPTGGDAELVVLPLSDGYHLAYRGQASIGFEIVNVFVDANTGTLLRQYRESLNEGVVGKGKGTYGDDKKVSVSPMAGAFIAADALRPAAITTYDLKGNVGLALNVANRLALLGPSDIAVDTDNDWTDSTVVDAHVYAGWYYDYLFKRFGRRGIDDRNLRMAIVTHPARLSDIFTASPNVVGNFYLNAFAQPSGGPDTRGFVLFGEGAPLNFVGPGIEVKPFSAALDVVAHELTHQVTFATANFSGFPFSEGGALHEGFSDIFGVSTAFFSLPAGSGHLQADYVIGKDLSVPTGAFAIRNLANPAATRDPDHYTGRVIGGDPHFNSTIPSHAFFLAIEGGTNRTSGRTVQGVGANNRDQIEKAFFRALTMLLTSGATFAQTRVATIQAARDLFGSGSAAERAITQAWDAVGVAERTVPTVALGPNPAFGQNGVCPGFPQPNWVIGATASAGSATLRVTNWTLNLFDSAGGSIQTSFLGSRGQFTSGATNTAAAFAQTFIDCGPGSTSIAAQSDACSSFCISLNGQRSGGAELLLSGVDDTGRTFSTASARIVLAAPR